MLRRGDKVVTGVWPARVVNNVDPHGLGRVQISMPPTLSRQPSNVWARLATLAAGDGRGTWFPPAVGDEVLVAFEAGDISHPVVLGSIWSTGTTPPETGESQTERTTIRTRSGALIRIDDGSQAAPPSITIESATGESVFIGPSGVTVASASTVVVSAAAKVEINASVVEVNAGLVRFSGTVQCETLVADSVVAASYSPGAGNIM